MDDNKEKVEACDELVCKRNATSVIWRYFGYRLNDTEQKDVICKTCHIKVTTSRGNTTNLYQHLKQHKDKYEECKQLKAQTTSDKDEAAQNQPGTCPMKRQQNTITQVFARITPYDNSSRRHREITDAITNYLAKGMVPIYTVEKEGFRKMIRTLDRRYELPGRNHFSNTAIPHLYSKCRRKVQAEIATVKYFSTTTDLWSSRTSEPYISLTVHFIDDNFDLKSRCLQTSYFPQDHTGENIAAGLKEALHGNCMGRVRGASGRYHNRQQQ